MRAFHVYSTAPLRTYYGRSGSTAFVMKDFEILAAVLSALEWRKHNGSIKLYTDELGAEYFHRVGLSFLWDEGMDTETLENCAIRTNPTVFWAFARTVALGAETCPCALLDMDLIVWRNIAGLIRSPFMAIHSEPLEFEVYVDREELRTPSAYVWDAWDWTASPVNAALMYFADGELKALCVKKGLEFMDGNFMEEERGWPVHAVFVEQRLYPMCARKLGVETAFFLQDYRGLELADGSANDAFTHLWLYKRKLMNDTLERERVCARMGRRIARDFPEAIAALSAVESVRPYLPAREA